MLDAQVQGVLSLVRAALTGEAQVLPADFDLEGAYDAIMKHNIAVMALEGAVRCGIDKKLPVMQKLFVQAFQAIGRVEAQDRAAGELFAAFEEENIDFMPVKGALLRGLYPKREYRSMGDMDILIRVEQYDRVRAVMERLDYDGCQSDDHVFVWKNNVLMLELHRFLITEYYSHFESGWKHALPTATSRFQMKPEEHYLFVVAHLADHYRCGGVGIRQMCDVWLLRRANPGMDEAYIRAALGKLELLEFYDNILQTLSLWFEDGNLSEKTEFITGVIYRSGAFGRQEEQMLSDGARLAGEERASVLVRYQNVLHRMFLPWKDMRYKYPVLQKVPVLLPVMWIYRACLILVHEPGKVARLRKRFDILDQENVNAYQHSLKYVGLKFSNKTDK